LGGKVACLDFVSNKNADINFGADEYPHSKCKNLGFHFAIVALPDNILFKHVNEMIDSGSYTRILID
jgi:hypothetical protein